MVLVEIENPMSWQSRLIRELFLIKKLMMNGVIRMKFLLGRFVFLSPVSVIALPYKEGVSPGLLFGEPSVFNL